MAWVLFILATACFATSLAINYGLAAALSSIGAALLVASFVCMLSTEFED